jgi:acetyl esterase
MLAAAGGSPSPQDMEQRRKSLEDLAELAAGEPVEVACVEDIDSGLPFGLRRYRPEGATRPLVYLHGGGWTAGGLHTHDSVCRTLAAEGPFEVFAVDYRRAPAHPFPGPIQDAVEAIDWVAAQTGTTPLLAGDSAGGNLAAAAVGQTAIAALLLICPILDLAEESPSRRAYREGHFIAPDAMAADLTCYLQDADPADPRASPLRMPDLTGWPPTFIHVAEFDPFHDEGVALAKRLQAAGVDVRLHEHAGMIHYFYALPRLIPHAGQALAGMAKELRA